MNYIIAGLGNPEKKYEETRHNAGRMLVSDFHKKMKFPAWKVSRGANALFASGKIGRHNTELVLPETFMNDSGKALAYAKNKHKIRPENIVIVYDDIDLPLGKVRISFGKGSGGHKGLESVIKSIRSKNFIRVRIGISPTAPSGKLKKPKGEKAVFDFIIGKFGKSELQILKKVSRKVSDILEEIVLNGADMAMNTFN